MLWYLVSSVNLSVISMSPFLSVILSVSVLIYLFCLSICLSVSLLICLFCLSICLSVSLLICLFYLAELDHGLSEPQIVCITHQLFQALAFLHSHNCIHRDLKAGNILLCPDGSIRLGWSVFLSCQFVCLSVSLPSCQPVCLSSCQSVYLVSLSVSPYVICQCVKCDGVRLLLAEVCVMVCVCVCVMCV